MSISLLTNSAALTALSALDRTQKSISKYENQISTGLAVSSAADNAAYWSMATSMNSEVGALGAVSDDLSESAGLINVTYTALSSIINLTNGIKNDLITAEQPGADQAAIQTDVQAKQNAIIAAANGATFNGQNWLVDNWTFNASVNATTSYDVPAADVTAIQNSWNGSYNETDTTQYDEVGQDSWGSSFSGETTTVTSATYSFSSTPNGHGGTNHSKTVSNVSETTTSSGYALIPKAVAKLPATYTNAGGVSFMSTDLSGLKLFDNYTFTGTSASSSSSYDAPPPVNYNSSLPDEGFGILTAPIGSVVETLNGTQVAGNLLNLNVDGLDTQSLNSALSTVEKVSAQVTTAASLVGSELTHVQSQQTYLSNLAASLTSGVGALVDADMNQASTKMAALQVQQQLGVQALSIANSDAQIVLKLFGP